MLGFAPIGAKPPGGIPFVVIVSARLLDGAIELAGAGSAGTAAIKVSAAGGTAMAGAAVAGSAQIRLFANGAAGTSGLAAAAATILVRSAGAVSATGATVAGSVVSIDADLLPAPPYTLILDAVLATLEGVDWEAEAGIDGLTVRHYRNRPPTDLERPALTLLMVGDEPADIGQEGRATGFTAFEDFRELKLELQVDLDLSAVSAATDPSRLDTLSRVLAVAGRALRRADAPVRLLCDSIGDAETRPDLMMRPDAGRLARAFPIRYRVLPDEPNVLLAAGWTPAPWVASPLAGMIAPPHIRLLNAIHAALLAAPLAAQSGIDGIQVRHYAEGDPHPGDMPCLSIVMVSDQAEAGGQRNMWEMQRSLDVDLQVDLALKTEGSADDPTGLADAGRVAAAAVAAIMAPGSPVRLISDWLDLKAIANDEDSTPDEGRFVPGVTVLYRVHSDDDAVLVNAGENA